MIAMILYLSLMAQSTQPTLSNSPYQLNQLHFVYPEDVPPMDVSPIQVEVKLEPHEPLVIWEPRNCVDGYVQNALYGPTCAGRKYWTCKDTSRVLLISENGERHCIRF